MSSFQAIFVTLIVAACMLVHQGASQPVFVGAFQPATNLSNYELATIADISSAEFVEQYNTVGINFVQAYPDGMLCCVVRVYEGFLAVHSPKNTSDINFIESFANNTDMCTSGTSPWNTTFGVPSFMPGPFSGKWFYELNRTVLSVITAVKTIPSPSYASCAGTASPSHLFTAIFKLKGWHPTVAPTPVPTPATPTYIIQPNGPNYPAPTGYSEMYLNQVTSPAFAAAYNQAGGIWFGGAGSTNYCCMIRVADGGWLTYGAENDFSPLSLILPNGMWQCNQQSNGQLHWFATSFGGSINAQLPSLNTTTSSLLGYFTNDTMHNFDDCNAFPDSLTLFMQN